MNVKEKFPNEAAFKKFLGKNIPRYTKEIYSEIGPLHGDYVEARRNNLIGKSLMVSAFVLLFSIQFVLEFFSNYLISTTSLLLSVVVLIIWGWKKYQGTAEVIKRFNTELNEIIFSKIFAIFDLKISVVPSSELELGEKFKQLIKFFQSGPKTKDSLTKEATEPLYEPTEEVLNVSELITEPRNRFASDDTAVADLGDKKLFMSELDIKNVTGSGKNRQVKEIFHGYLFAVDLPRPLTGKTFVSAEGDTRGFGHQALFGGGDISKTELEWNDFENKLHVSTSDPVEARYILTTDFMVDLYDWWKEKEQQIRVSFIGQKMYLIYPDKKIRLNKTVKEISESEIKEYMECISIPLLHSLYLVEDVVD
jgi:hypothetical protein